MSRCTYVSLVERRSNWREFGSQPEYVSPSPSALFVYRPRTLRRWLGEGRKLTEPLAPICTVSVARTMSYAVLVTTPSSVKRCHSSCCSSERLNVHEPIAPSGRPTAFHSSP